MIDGTSRLKVDKVDVAAKVLDGELVVLNLSSGSYYSANPVATAIWQLLERGHSIDGVASLLEGCNPDSPESVRSDVRDFVEKLVADKLLLPDDQPAIEIDESGAPELDVYSPPELTAHRDLMNLLAVDPPLPGTRARLKK